MTGNSLPVIFSPSKLDLITQYIKTHSRIISDAFPFLPLLPGHVPATTAITPLVLSAITLGLQAANQRSSIAGDQTLSGQGRKEGVGVGVNTIYN